MSPSLKILCLIVRPHIIAPIRVVRNGLFLVICHIENTTDLSAH